MRVFKTRHLLVLNTRHFLSFCIVLTIKRLNRETQIIIENDDKKITICGI